MQFFNFNQLKSFTKISKPAFEGIQAMKNPGSQEQLYTGAGYVLLMTRKDKMRQGFVARTFHIHISIDDELRMMAIKNHVRFSDEAIAAFKDRLT